MKYIVIFSSFFICHFVYQYYNIFIAKNSSHQNFFAHQFESQFTYTAIVLLAFTPLLTLANYGFGLGFGYGFKNFDKNIWQVTIVFIAAQLISTILAAYLLLNSTPTKGNFAGLMFALVGLIISQIWK